MKRLHNITAVAAAMAAALLLSSCTATPPHLSALDREATPADTLPEGVRPFGPEAHTVRLVANDEGVRYFLGQTADAASSCLAVVPDNHPGQWAAGCGQTTDSDQELVRTEVTGLVTAVLVPDNYDASQLIADGFTSVHQNIYVIRTNRIPGA